ncbi:hypothetical protein OIU84_009405 [Salix udensis]|uniref:Thaumatin-like protein 1 n=1 Tax=Salix udensis TaxID=889485 RepID=A0AAD6JS22_9ROSI|nr:hypothetical protein OIU84_009405 [Salix udensis]
MDHFSCRFSSLISTVVLLFLASYKGGVLAATFTFVNKCEYTVWPGILPNAGSPSLDSTGFELPKDSSRSFIAPTGWSGRFWARTGCNFVESGVGSCSTGDCGSGQVECNGLGAAPPATLAEFTLGSGGQDFYDVSLVDGYNLPMVIEGSGGSGMCASTGCVSDINRQCPQELRSGEGDAFTLMMMPPALLLVVALIIQLPFALPPQVRNLQATQHQRQKEQHHRDLLQDPGLGYAGTGSDTGYGAGSGTGSGRSNHARRWVVVSWFSHGRLVQDCFSFCTAINNGGFYHISSPCCFLHFLVALGPFLSVSWLLLLNENSFQICSLDGCRILPLSGKLTDSLIQIVNH